MPAAFCVHGLPPGILVLIARETQPSPLEGVCIQASVRESWPRRIDASGSLLRIVRLFYFRWKDVHRNRVDAKNQIWDCVSRQLHGTSCEWGLLRAGERTAGLMRPPNPDFRPTPPPGRPAGAVRSETGDERGEDVSPVPSDATGVRYGGVRGREDATRSRRRYITH